jgi:hypothetical protein
MTTIFMMTSPSSRSGVFEFCDEEHGLMDEAIIDSGGVPSSARIRTRVLPGVEWDHFGAG